MCRRYLVYFRAGLNSLHKRIINEDPLRNWDCCVSWYCPPQNETLAEFYEATDGNKLDSFSSFFINHLVNKSYHYFLLVDDDIYFNPGDISRFFELCERHNLYLSQPSLKWGTYANHDVTLHNPLCEVRQTRFVEVMTPCFSRDALVRLLHTFCLNRSTWGIDYAWASLLTGEGNLAIVDAVQVCHTKPVSVEGGAFYLKLRSNGIDPQQEYRQIKQTFRRFGSFGTEKTGHSLVLPLPNLLMVLAVRICEETKKRIHRYRLRNSMR